ncbi:hypothetical protein D3C75_912150 [compost metagenome]
MLLSATEGGTRLGGVQRDTQLLRLAQLVQTVVVHIAGVTDRHGRLVGGQRHIRKIVGTGADEFADGDGVVTDVIPAISPFRQVGLNRYQLVVVDRSILCFVDARFQACQLADVERQAVIDGRQTIIERHLLNVAANLIRNRCVDRYDDFFKLHID